MYGEALAAESRKDFIHKMKLALKELQESLNCLRIIHRKKYIKKDEEKLSKVLRESDELVAILSRVLDCN